MPDVDRDVIEDGKDRPVDCQTEETDSSVETSSEDRDSPASEREQTDEDPTEKGGDDKSSAHQENHNKGQKGDNFNLGKADRDININTFRNDAEKKGGPQFRTIDYSLESSRLLTCAVTDEELTQWARSFYDTRFLVIACAHEGVLEKTVSELLQSPNFSAMRHRLLLSVGDQDPQDGGHKAGGEEFVHPVLPNLVGRELDYLSEEREDEESDKDHPSVIVVHLDDTQWLEAFFLDFGKFRNYRSALANRNRFVVIRIIADEIMGEFERRIDDVQNFEEGERYCFRRFSFLRPLLSCYFPETDAEGLTLEIYRQWKEGRWGDPDSERELCRWVSRYLREGVEELRRIVDSHGPEVRSKTIDELELFESVGEVGQTVLYAVAHFPNLPPSDLERLVDLLLADRVVKVKETRVVGVEGAYEIQEVKVEQRLVEIWRRDPDRVLAECEVRSFTQDDETQVVDFSEPTLGERLRKLFKRRFIVYSRQSLRKLLQTGLLFESGKTRLLRDRTAELVAEAALADSSFLDSQWLGRQIFLLQLAAGSGSSVEVSDDVSDEAVLKHLVEIARKERLWSQVLPGLARLMRVMLQHARLRPLVKNWLDGLMQTGEREIILRFVLSLAKSLRFNPHFDGLYWFRQLINQSTEKECLQEIYPVFLRWSLDRQLQIHELLESLSSWLPDPDVEGEIQPRSSAYALTWMVIYCLQTVKVFDDRRAGEWPSSYPLFTALDPDQEEYDSRVKLMVGWLFHRRMADGLKATKILSADALSYFRAAVLEEWFWILQGADPEIDPEEPGSRLADRLLRRALRSTKRPETRELVAIWRQRQLTYLRITESLKREDRKDREILSFLKKKRRSTMLLERRFKELHRSTQRGKRNR